MRRSLAAAVLLLAACATTRGGNDAVDIKLAHGSAPEQAKAEQMRRIIDAYDLSKWTYTRTVIIDDKAQISHSHPVLTLDAPAETYSDDANLAAYVHEQLHWLETDNPEKTETAIAELRKLYPDAPKRPPEGARDQYSTYLHLLVCHWEFEAMKELVGEERARAAMKKPYYRWVYRTVLADNEKIKEVAKRAGF